VRRHHHTTSFGTPCRTIQRKGDHPIQSDRARGANAQRGQKEPVRNSWLAPRCSSKTLIRASELQLALNRFERLVVVRLAGNFLDGLGINDFAVSVEDEDAAC
jgi:hypothetical protein